MGYNVGGIVGRQSGYLDGCVNTGTVKGRKDVGGIAGQMEPQVTLKYNRDALENLWDELDKLEALMDQTADDAEGASDRILGAMSDLTDSIGIAKDATSDLTDAMTDWANGNIDQINDLSARISWVIDQMEPILNDVSASLDDMRTAADELSAALDELSDIEEPLDASVGELKLGLDDLEAAIDQARDVMDDLDAAMDCLKKGLGDPAEVSAALNQLGRGLAAMTDAVGSVSVSVAKIAKALPEILTWLAQNREQLQALPAVISTLESLAAAFQNVGDKTQPVGATIDSIYGEVMAGTGLSAESLAALAATSDELNSSLTNLNAAYDDFLAALEAYTSAGGSTSAEMKTELANLDTAMTTINAANTEIQTASDPSGWASQEAAAANLQTLQAGLSQMEAGLLQAVVSLERLGNLMEQSAISTVPGLSVAMTEYESIQKNLKTIDTAFGQIAGAIHTLAENLNAPDLNLDVVDSYLDAALKSLSGSAGSVSDAVGHINSSTDSIQEAGNIAGNALETASHACEDLGDALSHLGDSVDEIKEVFHTLSEEPEIRFQTISSNITNKGNALDDALGDMLGRLDDLSSTMNASADTLVDNFRAINAQLGVVINTLHAALDDTKGSLDEDHFEDVSDTALGDDTARITGSRNEGTVEGDVNAAGIVGSLAIEYDFDPEDDLTETGERSLDFRYQAAAVVRDSVNLGQVTAKKDCAGGVVGRMDLGYVSDCGSYGPVESTDGDYVGGVVGLTRAHVQNCFAKCTLSGGQYIGGITGAAAEDAKVTSCYAMVEIKAAEQDFGAVSGDEVGEFQNNFFVSDALAGLGRVSYAGRAEPLEYGELLAVDGLPDVFGQFTLRFVVEEEILQVVSFSYGDSFGAEVFPTLPSRPGYYARWDTDTLADLRFDTVVEGIYTPYTTALASDATRESGRSVLYAEGSFNQHDHLTLRAVPVEESDFGAAPEGKWNRRTLTEEWSVMLPEDGQTVHTLRYLPADGADGLQLYVKGPEGWTIVESQKVGQYLIFQAEGTEVELAVFSLALYTWVWALLAAIVAALVIFVIVWVVIKRKKEKRAVALASADEGGIGHE